MKTFVTSLVVAAGLAASAGASHAATLGYETDAPFLTGTGDVFYLPGSDFVFSEESDAVVPIAAAFSLGGEPDDEIGFVSFGRDFEITEIGTSLGEGADRIELLFDQDGALSLAALTGEFGTEADFGLSELFTTADIEISRVSAPAVIPLPAGGVLLLSGLALLRLRKRMAG